MKKNLLCLVFAAFGFNANAQTYDTLACFLIPDQLALGVAFDYVNNYYVISSGGQSNTDITDNYFFRYDLSFNLVDSVQEPQGTTSGFGIRDLAFDGTFIYGSYDQDVQKFDAATLQPVSSFTGFNNPNRGLAVDSDGTFFSSNFATGNVEHFDISSSSLANCPGTSLTGNAPYGLGVERFTDPGTPRLWMCTPSLAGLMFLTRYDFNSCQIDTAVDLSALTPPYSDVTATTAGGVDITDNHPNYPGKLVGLVLGQNNPTAYVMLIDMTPINTGISSIDQPGNISVFPNPANDFINVTLENLAKTNYTISVFDNMGKEVLTSKINDNKATISVDILPTGIYTIKAVSDKQMVFNKFQVTR